MSLLDFVSPDALQRSISLSEEDARTITGEVIARINGEFQEAALRSPTDADRQAVRARIGALVAAGVRRAGLNALSTVDEARLADEIARKVLGLGFLDLLLPPARTDLTEIAITPAGKLFAKIKGRSRFEELTDLHPDPNEVERVIAAVIGPQGRSLNESTPSVDAKLPRTRHNPGGGRIKVIHACVAPGAGFPSLNIRLFEQRPVRPEQLVAWGSMDEQMMSLLESAIRQYLRIFIIGGTGTGKTTILSALTGFIAQDDRIVKIEDPEEIFIDHPHVVALEARPAPPGSEVPPYTITDGVNDAMRMTPDWLVVGEVRTGDAAMSLFRAQMSDHPGLSTFHSESPEAAVHRLSVIMFSDVGVRMEASKSLFTQSVDLVLQLGYDCFGRRRTTEIAQVEREMKGGNAQFTPLFRLDEDRSTEARPVWEKLGELTRKRR
ncbi:MAG: CpaF family protein [Anaerolineae bacterium]|nr:CpaF family protein [Anaerolineae bacterium]